MNIIFKNRDRLLGKWTGKDQEFLDKLSDFLKDNNITCIVYTNYIVNTMTLHLEPESYEKIREWFDNL